MKVLFQAILVFFFSLAPLAASSSGLEELELLNRPVNTSGLTGLLFTTAPYTIPSGMVEISGVILYENSIRPDFSITELPFGVTVGIGEDKEMALRSSYVTIKEGPAGSEIVSRRTGDLRIFFKWNFIPQTEDSPVPGVALILSGDVPLDDKTRQSFDTVSHWAVSAGLSAGTEIVWKEYAFGIYADAQVSGQDITEERLRDLYELVNAGLLFPISKYRNLQMFVEYSLVTGIDKIPLSGGDQTAFTYGFRLVGDRFNLTLGSQFIHKKKSELYDNSGKLISLMSFKF